MPNYEEIQQGLLAYADRLQEAGFRVYIPTPASPGRRLTYFAYARDVDGSERPCYGFVQYKDFFTFDHTMPIKPSRENGSSMFVQDVNEVHDPDDLTVEQATRVASPSNWNEIVGTQQNYYDEACLAKHYIERKK